MNMLKIRKSRAEEILKNAKGKHIAVIGDVMLDKYLLGSVSRVSPEAPVPVIDFENETNHLGGAANVAKNLSTLGVFPILCGVIGDDDAGKEFANICNQTGINPAGLYIDKARPTTVKTRLIGNNQQIARLDKESRNQITSDGEEFISNLLIETKDLAAIVFEDYDKGTITTHLIQSVMQAAKLKNIPVFVDPKYINFFEYKDTFLVKPNRKEAEKALGFEIRNENEVMQAGKELISKLQAENILITLGDKGMMLFEKSGVISSVPTRARKISDVSGAGDTAVATMAAAIAGGADVREAATMANFASGVVCEEPGIVAIEIDSLLKAIDYISYTEAD